MTVVPPSHGSGGTSALMPTLVQKELRALAPVFTATAVLVALCRVGLESELMTLGMGVYVLGAAALGALSLGHEFTHDTLGQLLAQPGHRARLLIVKLLVLAALLGLLAAAAAVTVWPWIERGFVGVGYGDKTEAVRWPILLIPVLLAAFVAPLLTMLSRSAIAGTVFTVGVYAGLWLIAPGITSLSFPEEGVDIEFYAGTMLWIAVGVSAMSAVAGAVMFCRLEYTGSHRAMAWTASRRNQQRAAQRASAPTLPAVALLQKELRLQTVSFVIAGLYVMAWAIFTIADSRSAVVIYAFEGGTLLYQFILAMLIGAVASSEERALGTLHWQVLQPYATWKQWAIKWATALTLTVLLVVTLPALNAHGADVVDRFWFPVRVHWTLSTLVANGQIWSNLVILLAVVTTALFASSFNHSSLHALLTTGLLLFIGGIAIGTAFVAGTSAVWEGLDLNAFYHRLATSGGRAEALWGKTWTPADDLWTRGITLVVVVAAIVGFLLLTLRAGLKNYRSAETPRGVVTRQVLWLLAFCIAACLLVGGGQPALQYYLITR